MPLVLISYLRKGQRAYTSTLDRLEALKQNGIPVVTRPGDTGTHITSPCCGNITCQFCWSVGHLTYAEDSCWFAYPISGPSFEVAESLKRGSVSCVAMLARTSGKATVGHPTEALGRGTV